MNFNIIWIYEIYFARSYVQKLRVLYITSSDVNILTQNE